MVLTILYGQTRIFFAMCRDGLLPRRFAKVTERRRPRASPPTFGFLIARLAAFVPLKEIVEAREHRHAVRVRRSSTSASSSCGAPGPTSSAASASRWSRVPDPRLAARVYLMADLSLRDVDPVRRWLVIGLVIYFAYGIRHSRLRQGRPSTPRPTLPDAAKVSAPARGGHG